MDTHKVTINPAFLQEIKDDDVQLLTLLQQVREMCDSVAQSDIPARRFASVLAELRDRLAMHFALEEAYGYFDDPVTVAPHLSEQAESLRKQHGKLYEEMVLLAETAQNISRSNSDPRGVGNLARGFINFHGRLLDHEEGENELILDAYSIDIGGRG